MAGKPSLMRQKAERLAAWLSGHLIYPNTTPVTAEFDDRPLQQWLGVNAEGTEITADGAALFTGSAAAFMAAYRASTSTANGDGSNDQWLRRRTVPKNANAWSGFVPVGRAWLSIALAD